MAFVDSANQDPSKYGRLIRIARNPGNRPSSWDGVANTRFDVLWTPVEEDADVWTITVQGQKLPEVTGEGGTVVDGRYNLYINYMIGAATFQKVVPFKGLIDYGPGTANIRRIPIHARGIRLEIEWVGVGGTSYDVAEISIGIERGQLNSTLFIAPSWYAVTPPDYHGWKETVIVGPGTLIAFSGFLIVAPPVPVYPMAFDCRQEELISSSVSASAQRPISGSVGPPISAIGDAFSFSDESDPQLGFVRALSIALSTDPQYYNDPGGGKFRVDAKIGQ